jgi:hypothetical protein
VAGANDFAGLAAMSATSHLMHTELNPILYETIVWNDDLHQRLHVSISGVAAPEFRYVRYVFSKPFFPEGNQSPSRFILLQYHRLLCMDAHKDRIFPGLRVIIKKDSETQQEAAGNRTPPVYSASIYVLRNTTTAALSSVLQLQLKWSPPKGPVQRSSIRSISYIEIAPGATLTKGGFATHGHFRPMGNPNLIVKVKKDVQHVAEPQRIDASVGAIRQMIVTSDRLRLRPARGSTATETLSPVRLVHMFDNIPPPVIQEVLAQFDDRPPVETLERLRAMNDSTTSPQVVFHIEHPDPANIDTWIAQVG